VYIDAQTAINVHTVRDETTSSGDNANHQNRCSQRRQKCDRKTPCKYSVCVRKIVECILIWQGSRCVQNKEAHLCTTTWKEGYNPSVHRRYPKKLSSAGNTAESSDASSTLYDSASSGIRENALTTGVHDIAASETHLAHPIVRPPLSISESRLLDITIGSLLNEKDAATPNPDFSSQNVKYVKSAGKQMDEANRITSFCSPTARAMEIQHIQGLLPNQGIVMTITDYYHRNMLYWMGGIYHGPSFRKELLQAYGSSDTLDLQTIDWRWSGLLCTYTPVTNRNTACLRPAGLCKLCLTFSRLSKDFHGLS
jgi:hypothetical protein